MYIDDNAADKSELTIPNVSSMMDAGAWNHIVAVRDRDNSKLIFYINGQEAASGPDITKNTISSPGLPLRIGSNMNAVASEGVRQMDDIRLYNVALSPEDVKSLLGQYVPSVPASLSAWWKLDGNADDDIATAHGTLVGGDAANYVGGLDGQALDLSIGANPTYVEVADTATINLGKDEFTVSLLLNVAD
jgi:hypothetical protein